MFAKIDLDDGTDWFQALSTGVLFERLGPGRRAAVLVAPAPDGSVPIVRTTTSFVCPAQTFPASYQELVSLASKTTGARFNNALVEIYDAYASMGFHTDQSIDLEPCSTICLFSCYSTSDKSGARRILRTRQKATGEERDVDLTQGSLVVFSTATNGLHLHKIMKQGNGGEWLGLTLRLSKTFVHPTAPSVHLASSEERREFVRLKRLENATDGPFAYPDLAFTLSASDLVTPLGADSRQRSG